MQRGRQSAWKSTLTQHEHPCVAAGFLLQGCKLLCQSVWCWGGIPSGRSLAVVVSAGLNSPAKCFPLGCSVWHGELELMLSHSSITDLALEEQMSSRSKTSALPPGMGLAHTCYIHTHKKKNQPNNKILLWMSMNVWVSLEDFWSHQPSLTSFEKGAGISRAEPALPPGLCMPWGWVCWETWSSVLHAPLHAYLPETGPRARGNMVSLLCFRWRSTQSLFAGKVFTCKKKQCRQTSWCPRLWKNFSSSFCFCCQTRPRHWS